MAGTRNRHPLRGPTTTDFLQLDLSPQGSTASPNGVTNQRPSGQTHERRGRVTFHTQTIISINIYHSVFMLVLGVSYVLHGPGVSSIISVCGHNRVHSFTFSMNLCRGACHVLLRNICIHAEQRVCRVKSHDQKAIWQTDSTRGK